MQQNQFLKVNNSVLQLEKDFIELKDIELKEREVKNKRDIEELFFKTIMVSKDDMDKFKQKEMKKIRPLKNTWYNWLINYIPEPIRKGVGGFKDKIVSLFETNTPKQNVYGRGKKLSKPKEDHYKPERLNNFWNNNCIEYESNGNKNRNLSLNKYLNKIEPYLRNVIIDLQKSDARKIQLTIGINFISSKDAEEE